MYKVLLVDDELEMLESLNKILSFRKEFDITPCNNPHEALGLIKDNDYDLIISDLKMKDIDGIEILNSALSKNSETIVIIISGYGTIESSVEAIKLGAFDFIEKPFASKKLFDVINRGLKKKTVVQPVTEETNEDLLKIVHESAKMKEILEIIKKIAPTEMNVLIIGESGTGKELIARAIHNLSKGKDNPFVPVNCGALPEQLFESELFGHEKGSFTGAVKTKPGLLEFANNGTFFFDEIGEMTLSLQVKLLRMLEERKIRRIGGQYEIDINVRIIAATNKNLEKLVKEGLFRDDLFYRLNSMKIEVPPLRERREDILPLIMHYINHLCSSRGQKPRKFTNSALEALVNHSWPGNVRELQNIINRTYYLCSNEVIQLNDLPLTISKKADDIPNEILSLNYKDAKERVVEKFELDYLTHHLRLNDGNISKTAESCGLDRRTIHRLISRYDIIFKK